jgi:hypothetical protein
MRYSARGREVDLRTERLVPLAHDAEGAFLRGANQCSLEPPQQAEIAIDYRALCAAARHM